MQTCINQSPCVFLPAPSGKNLELEAKDVSPNINQLVCARDQTCLPCEFGANPFSGFGDILYTNKKTRLTASKTNLPQ